MFALYLYNKYMLKFGKHSFYKDHYLNAKLKSLKIIGTLTTYLVVYIKNCHYNVLT